MNNAESPRQPGFVSGTRPDSGDLSEWTPGKSASTPLLLAKDLTKLYEGVPAIETVDFSIDAGEVHALAGENGAGKSTLCKILSGAVQQTSGELAWEGEPVSFDSPNEALKYGISMVYQETNLVPTMTVAQNIYLGLEPRFTTFRSINIAAQQLLRRSNFWLDPTMLVERLGGAQKKMVQIARALRQDARLLIFDEPTASLTPEENVHLFEAINGLRRAGVAIIFVSHALEESLQIADRVSVLRNGRLVAAGRARELTREELVRHVVGRELDSQEPRKPTAATRDFNRRVLRVENVTMGSTVKNMSFSVYAGEVLGLAGLVGSGRTEIAKIIVGALKRRFFHGGMIYLHDKPIRYRVPKQAVDDGIVYITEDRKVEGYFETMNVEDNVYLGRLATRMGRSLFIKPKERSRTTRGLIERLQIRATGTRAKVSGLSGGNQQKVVVAKSLAQEPEIVIFDEPTRGVDVGAIEEIHQIIRTLAEEGKAVIVISSYLPEILNISDRILVIRHGSVSAEFEATEATQEKLLFASVY